MWERALHAIAAKGRSYSPIAAKGRSYSKEAPALSSLTMGGWVGNFSSNRNNGNTL